MMYLTDDDFDLHKVKEYIQKIENKDLRDKLSELFEKAIRDVMEKNKNFLFSKTIL